MAEAIGPLPVEAQVDLAKQLIQARGQYIAHRVWAYDPEISQGLCRQRLERIGTAAAGLLRALHRDTRDQRSGNLHPAITRALPRLFELSTARGTSQIWDGGLTRLSEMLNDLAALGNEAKTIFQGEFPRKHGGSRRAGSTPSVGLIADLIAIYAAMRAQYPTGGPAPAFDSHLRRFVRAGLAFAVAEPPEFVDAEGTRYQVSEARFLEPDLSKASRVTDASIRGVFNPLAFTDQVRRRLDLRILRGRKPP